jgi:hypothetical protein
MCGQRAFLRGALVAFLAGLVLTPNLRAQVVNGHQWPTPRLSVLTPTGGKAGTTFEVAFAGTEVEEPQGLLFSHPLIKGTPIIPPIPPVDPKAKDPKKTPVQPPITKFTVTIDKDVPVGFYDVRLVNKNGVSNPRRFVVGAYNEVAEKEPNNDVEQAQKVEIGTTVTGVINAGTDVDYFAFPGKKGQRVLINCLTASIDSRLDAEIAVKGPRGNDVGYQRPMPHQDTLVDLTLPEDGEYLVRLNKFTYTIANAEYFYRLNIASSPYIESVFPPMIEPGKTAQVTLYGRNLPGGAVDPKAMMNGQTLEKLTVQIAAPGDPAARDQMKYSGIITPLLATLDGFEYRLTGPGGVSNPVALTYARAPVVIENDDNDTAEKAQAVPVPCEIAGRIDKPRDRDWYVFEAKKGDVLMIEVLSHRLGAPTDMYFVLKNLATKSDITLQDDTADTLSLRFYTVNRDPAPFRFVAPADGKFHLMLASHTGDNYTDPTNIYCVRISKEQPDFRLYVMPADETRPEACRLCAGGTHHYTVYAHRTDGYKGDILLTMEGLPAGVTCSPQVLAGNMKFTQLVVSAADGAAEFTGAVKVVGAAVVNGQKVTRQARPATVTWGVPIQQNIPTVTRLDRDLMLAVRGKAPGKLVATNEAAVVSLGDKIELPLKLSRSFPEFKANFQVLPVPGDFPAGITFPNLTFAPGKDEVKASLAVAANTPPGTYNITFRGFAAIPPADKAKPVNTILISTPIKLTVLPKQVATLSVDNANPTIKTGATGMITIKVARQFEYADALKVELILPPNVKSVAADPITIAPGQNEAKMTLRIAPETPPANLQNLIVRATAVVNGNVTLTHETKINVIVAK